MAWANIATPACCSTCARVRLAVSCAKSASWIREREAERFSVVLRRFEITESKRLLMAPMVAREEFTEVSALSSTPIACCELVKLCTLVEFIPVVAVEVPTEPAANPDSATVAEAPATVMAAPLLRV